MKAPKPFRTLRSALRTFLAAALVWLSPGWGAHEAAAALLAPARAARSARSASPAGAPALAARAALAPAAAALPSSARPGAVAPLPALPSPAPRRSAASTARASAAAGAPAKAGDAGSGRAGARAPARGRGGKGPAGPTVRFLQEGPISEVEIRPEGSLRRTYDGTGEHWANSKDLGGRTPVHILVGGGAGGFWGRDWIARDAALEAADAARSGEIRGLESVVIDNPENRPEGLPDDRFLALDLLKLTGNPSPEAVLEAVRAVNDFLDRHNLVGVGANAIINSFVVLAAHVQAALKERNPEVLANPVEAVLAAVDKAETARRVVARATPPQPWSATVNETGDDRETVVARARAAFRALQEARPGSAVVIKPSVSAGKAGVRKEDVRNPGRDILDEDAVEAAVRDIYREQDEFWSRPENAVARELHTVAEVPVFVLQEKITGTSEYDVEVVVSAGPGGTQRAQAFVIGNPSPVGSSAAEKGLSFGAILTPEERRGAVEAAFDSLLALWLPALPFGNYHIEVKVDERGIPFLIEVNPTRPGGASVVPDTKEWTRGASGEAALSLVRQGVRASLGLPLTSISAQPKGAVVRRKILPVADGKLAGVFLDGRPVEPGRTVELAPGLELVINKALGSAVYAAGTELGAAKVVYADSVIGTVRARTEGAAHGSPEEGIRAALAALDRVTVLIETEDGRVVTQKGSAFHSLLDELPPRRAEPTSEDLGRRAVSLAVLGGAYATPDEARHAWELSVPGMAERVARALEAAPADPALAEARAVLEEALARRERARTKVLRPYYLGQLGNKALFAVYYPLFAVVMMLIGGRAAEGTGRMGYSGAIAASGPLSGVLVESMLVKRILQVGPTLRALIWSAAVPLSLWLVHAWLTAAAAPVYLPWVLFGLMAADGLIVSFTHAVDMDGMGMNLLAKQYDFPLDEALLNEHQAAYEAFGAKAQAFFPLAVAAAIALWGSQAGAAVAAAGLMALVYAAATAWSLYHYSRIPEAAAPIARKTPAQHWAAFREGVVLAVTIPQIGRRILLDALERSTWNVLRLLTLPAIGLYMTVALGHPAAWAAVFAALLVSLSMAATKLAAGRMKKGWVAQAAGKSKFEAYKPVFSMMLKASLGTILIGLAYPLLASQALPLIAAGYALAAAGALVFNWYSTQAFLGARYMKIAAAQKHGVAGRVAGIDSSVSMAVDGVVMSLLVLGHVFLPVYAALWIDIAYILAVGLASRYLAPRLLFSAEERGEDGADKS